MTLNDIKEGHYFWIRKKSSEDSTKMVNSRVMFLSLIGYYTSLLILGYGIFHRLTGKSFKSNGPLIDAGLFFGLYIAIYFILVKPLLNKGEIDENIPETEKKRKKKIAIIYFVLDAISIPSSGLIFNFLVGS